METWKHLRAILLLPFTVHGGDPRLYSVADRAGHARPVAVRPGNPCGLCRSSAALLLCLGLVLMVATIRLFVTVGKGTLAPWNPPQRLVVRGVYRHVRNPMISGVLFVLLGEAVLAASLPLLGLFALAVIVNVVYIPLSEEPGLAKRFGDDYLTYKQNVPRWIPRLRPWPDRAAQFRYNDLMKNPLPPRLEVGPWRRQTELLRPARSRSNQPGSAGRGQQ